MADWENSYLGRRAINIRQTKRDAKTVSPMLFKLLGNWKNPTLFISCIDLISYLLRNAEITHCFLEGALHGRDGPLEAVASFDPWHSQCLTSSETKDCHVSSYYLYIKRQQLCTLTVA